MRRPGSALWLSLMLGVAAVPIAAQVTAQAQVLCVSNNVPPPELPVYEQPPIPAPGYVWTPGYWGGSASGYFWVPGTWVQPPSVGLLWTPGYWGWRDGIYTWSAGYWGPHVGFYGGVNYGFGYGGAGYEGGRWENGVFAYNRTVNNFGGVTITNVYEKTVIVNNTRVSFNGGSGGIATQPTPEEEAAAHEQHTAAIPAQIQHERTASTNTALLASQNHGHPAIAATATPGEFSGKGVVAARNAEPLANEPLNAEKRPEPGQAKLPNNEGRSANTEIKPVTGEAKPEAKPLNAEARPLAPESRPASNEAKPLNNEGKVENKIENRSANTETKPETRPITPEAKPAGEMKMPSEVKPNEPKPQMAAPAKPAAPPPHVAAEPKPAAHPAPAAHPKPEEKKHPG